MSRKGIKARSRMTLRRILEACIGWGMDFGMGFLERSHRDWNPRLWSNREIRKYGPVYKGDIINVGAWKDGDKEGGLYREYFPNARSYTIANYGGEDGESGMPDEKRLNLGVPYNGEYGQYDLVFSHTVIEHVFSVETVFDNLCSLSRDTVMSVVPFLQGLHGRDGSFDDYWRYTPFSLKEGFAKRGFKTLYCSWNDMHPLMNVYLFHVASRIPENYKGIFPDQPRPIVGIYGPGVSFSQFLFGDGRRVSSGRKLGNFTGSIFYVD